MLPIIDAHHHLWDLDACTYPWLREKGVRRFFGDPTPIQKNYLVSHLREDFGQLPIRSSVHIQVGVAPGDELQETAWLQQCADEEGFPNAIVASADLTRSDLASVLDAQQAHRNLRGIRQIIGRSTEEDRRSGTPKLLDAPAFQQGLKLLADRKLSFDLQLTPALLPAAAQVCSRIPEVSIALCHAGSLSDFSAAGLRDWMTGLKALAAHPNTVCKLSGFGMFDPTWQAQQVIDRGRRAIDCFGPQRIMFGSNFPVDRLYASYRRVAETFLETISCFSNAEQAAMAAGTAAAFYRLDDPTEEPA
ncbi:MAG: amidohydrolase family protein [Pseudomonadota bacterium]